MDTLSAKFQDSDSPFIIAEVGQAHDGSLGMAHAYLDALAEAGVTAVKFQTHFAEHESTKDDKFRTAFSFQDSSRYEYWKRMEFTPDQWAGLRRHAEEKRVGFLSTPFSLAAVEILEKLGVELWKIGSGDTGNSALVDAVLATGRPLIVSTGMSDWAELDGLVGRCKSKANHLALMHCESRYPTPLELVGLNNLDEMSRRYNLRVGLSDHSGKLAPALAAICRGYSLVEVHAVFDRRMFGPDTSSSLTIDEIATLCKIANDVSIMNSAPTSKDQSASVLASQKAIFGRSIAPSRDLLSGHTLSAEDLVPKKPGGGIPWAESKSLIGRKLLRNVYSSRLLKFEDLA